MDIREIRKLLGKNRELLSHRAKISGSQLTLPGRERVTEVFASSDRPTAVLRNMQTVFDHGRLSGTGYLCILPVDQGVEHTAGAAFAPNPDYFDPEKIVQLGLTGGCNAVVSSIGALSLLSRSYAHRIPFILKLNHNELLSYPNTHDQVMFASPKQAFNLGAVGVGATVYFGSSESRRQIQEVARAFEEAHALGMFTILWAYVRNSAFKTAHHDYSGSADITGQANYLAATLGADFVKQKLPESSDRSFDALHFGKTHPAMYQQLLANNPIDRARYQVLNCFSGRIGLLSSGGESKGKNDLSEAVRIAVINKRAGGIGVLVGRKVFQHPFKDGVEILHAAQDVYRSHEVTIAN